MTYSQSAAAPLPASFAASVMDSTETTRTAAPIQSMRTLSEGLDSGANIATTAVATAPTAKISQNTERKPQCSAIQPESRTSIPATPPLIAAIRPISVPRRTSSLTWLRRMISVIGMVGPEMPCSARATIRTPMFGARAASSPPRDITPNMMTRMRRRPTMSERRGRNRPHIAPPVKKAVWVSPTADSSVLSSVAIVRSTGESIEALSWKATAAVMSTNISSGRPPLRESTGSMTGVAAAGLLGPPERGVVAFIYAG